MTTSEKYTKEEITIIKTNYRDITYKQLIKLLTDSGYPNWTESKLKKYLKKLNLNKIAVSNQYEIINDDITILRVYNEINTHEVLIDTNIIPKINNYLWFVNSNNRVYTNKYINSNKLNDHLLLTRIVMNDNAIALFTNDNRLDLRASNLIPVSRQELSQLHGLYKANTSGIKGVSYDKSRNKWIANIKFNYKTYHLGRYNTIEEAEHARMTAEKVYYEFKFELAEFKEKFKEKFKEEMIKNKYTENKNNGKKKISI